jgi:hypothetical protein
MFTFLMRSIGGDTPDNSKRDPEGGFKYKTNKADDERGQRDFKVRGLDLQFTLLSEGRSLYLRLPDGCTSENTPVYWWHNSWKKYEPLSSQERLESSEDVAQRRFGKSFDPPGHKREYHELYYYGEDKRSKRRKKRQRTTSRKNCLKLAPKAAREEGRAHDRSVVERSAPAGSAPLASPADGHETTSVAILSASSPSASTSQDLVLSPSLWPPPPDPYLYEFCWP